MGITAYAGPIISYGVTTTASGAVTEYNDQRGPNLYDLGSGLMDPRAAFNYEPGGAVSGGSANVYGFWDNVALVDQVPTTVSTNCIATAQAPTANTALTLVSASNANITVGVSVVDPANGATATGLLAIDSSMGTLAFAQSGTINIWNPNRALTRCVQICLSSNLDGGNFTVAGRDVYGFKVSEQLAAGSTQLKSKKAYKYISNIIASTTITSTGVTIGVLDTYGFPLRADYAAPVAIAIGTSATQAWVTAIASNSVYAATATATSTTGDVRGTWASSVASSTATGVRLYMQVTPTPQNLQAISASDTSGMFGVTQFSSV